MLNNLRMQRRLYSNAPQNTNLVAPDSSKASASPGSVQHSFIPRVASLQKYTPRDSEYEKLEDKLSAKRERFKD